MSKKREQRSTKSHMRKEDVGGDKMEKRWLSKEELAGVAAKLFSPVGKNPYYRGGKAIRNFRELKDSLNEFTENEAQWVASWIEYLGDTNTAARIRQTPNRFGEIIKNRFNELLPYAS
jgi:hypothetical protein